MKEEEKMKKRILALFAALLLLCSAGCAEKNTPTGKDDVPQSDEQLKEPADESGEISNSNPKAKSIPICMMI